jgi:hypothetical protein
MGDDARRALREELGPRAAEALASLDDASAEHLMTTIRDARVAERKALQEAAESSLSFVPRFARGTVKKIVFGG